jgi:ribonucleoside-diphosphate reductase alpha chain
MMPDRKHLPATRSSVVKKGQLSGQEFYVTISFYDDDPKLPGEVFVTIAKQGSDLAILVDSWAIMVSLGLQYGMPWDKIYSKFTKYPSPNIIQSICEDINDVIKARCDDEGN